MTVKGWWGDGRSWGESRKGWGAERDGREGGLAGKLNLKCGFGGKGAI